MKRVITGCGAAMLFLTAGNSASAHEASPFYLKIEAGPALQEDLSLSSDVTSSAGKMEFGMGVRSDVAFGWQFSRLFSAEVQTGILWTPVDRIQADPHSSGTLEQIPFMGNILFRYPFSHHWSVWGGIGAGGSWNSLDVDTSLGHVSNSETTFAYQAMVGVNYAINHRFDVGLGYKYFATGDHDWTSGGIEIKTDHTICHSILASFTWHF